MEVNASAIKTLADRQTRNDERFKRMERRVEENTAQIKALSKGQAANQERVEEVMEEHRDQLKSLADGQAESVGWLQGLLEQSTKASGEMA